MFFINIPKPFIRNRRASSDPDRFAEGPIFEDVPGLAS
jgi:hypothetical protein